MMLPPTFDFYSQMWDGIEFKETGTGNRQGAIHFHSVNADQADSKVWLKVTRKENVLGSEWDLATDELEIHRSVSGLQHVIPLLLAERDDELIALAMPRASGGDLWEKTQHGNLTISEIEAKHFASQLLRGLSELHGMRIVHGDIKPHNILLVPQGPGDDRLSIALCDFGLSKRLPSELGGKIKFSEIRGTQGYISPEICTEQDYDEKIDIFAAGIVLFRLVAGAEPFYPVENFTERVEFADDCCGHLSEEFKDFLQSLLHLDPDRRVSASEALEHTWLSSKILEHKVDAENELGLHFCNQTELEQVLEGSSLMRKASKSSYLSSSSTSTFDPESESDESDDSTESKADQC